MAHEERACLLRQFDTAWKLATVHLDGLSTEECLWRPAKAGLHVRRERDGQWHAEWPQHERYDLGPPSIAWVTWHIVFWWSMVLDHSFGDATLSREHVDWPGSAEGVRDRIADLHGRWKEILEQVTDEELRSNERTRWPFRDRPFGDVVAWVNLELAKNAAELGYARFLHAVRSG
jgi:hypothetical protein